MTRKERAATTLPLPWDVIFRTEDSLCDNPELEASIHGDARLSPNAKGLLMSALSAPKGSACSAWLLYNSGVFDSLTLVRHLLKELYQHDYLRLEENVTANIVGAHPDASQFAFTYIGLFARTPLAEVVAGAQHVFFPADMPELVEA